MFLCTLNIWLVLEKNIGETGFEAQLDSDAEGK